MTLVPKIQTNSNSRGLRPIANERGSGNNAAVTGRSQTKLPPGFILVEPGLCTNGSRNVS